MRRQPVCAQHWWLRVVAKHSPTFTLSLRRAQVSVVCSVTRRQERNAGTAGGRRAERCYLSRSGKSGMEAAILTAHGMPPHSLSRWRRQPNGLALKPLWNQGGHVGCGLGWGLGCGLLRPGADGGGLSGWMGVGTSSCWLAHTSKPAICCPLARLLPAAQMSLLGSVIAPRPLSCMGCIRVPASTPTSPLVPAHARPRPHTHTHTCHAEPCRVADGNHQLGCWWRDRRKNVPGLGNTRLQHPPALRDGVRGPVVISGPFSSS